MKCLFLFALLITSQIFHSQTLTAKVVDEKNEPLMGAEVYFDRTTRGVLTDLDGNFSIKVPPNLSNPKLVIRYLGYTPIEIEDVYGMKSVYQLMLKPEGLENISVYTELFTRKQMERVFKKYFLGEGKAAKQAEILNLDDVILYYVGKENTLYAESLTPIEVKNKFLGYNLTFDLTNFEVKYHTKTLNDRFLKQTYYEGTTFFKDINPNKTDQRKIVYQSSLTHFFKNLIDSTLHQTPYKITYRGFFKEPYDAFNVEVPLDPEVNFCKININSDYIKTVNGKYTSTKFELQHINQRTTIVFKKPSIKVDRRGNLIDIVDLVLSGSLANDRVAKLLPVNFTPLP